MGQARKRGTRDERIGQAQQEHQREEPINVRCNTCKTEVLNGFTYLSSSAAGGAWQKKCTCGALTTVVMQAKHSNMARAFRSSLALKDEIAGTDKKVSVSFIEKTVDTVETGMIRLG